MDKSPANFTFKRISCAQRLKPASNACSMLASSEHSKIHSAVFEEPGKKERTLPLPNRLFLAHTNKQGASKFRNVRPYPWYSAVFPDQLGNMKTSASSKEVTHPSTQVCSADWQFSICFRLAGPPWPFLRHQGSLAESILLNRGCSNQCQNLSHCPSPFIVGSWGNRPLNTKGTTAGYLLLWRLDTLGMTSKVYGYSCCP